MAAHSEVYFHLARVRHCKLRHLPYVLRGDMAASTALASTWRSALTPSVSWPPRVADAQLAIALISSRNWRGGGKYSSSVMAEISSMPWTGSSNSTTS